MHNKRVWCRLPSTALDEALRQVSKNGYAIGQTQLHLTNAPEGTGFRQGSRFDETFVRLKLVELLLYRLVMIWYPSLLSRALTLAASPLLVKGPI